MRIGGATVVAGLVGRPIGGSLSPAIHNAWLAHTGLDGIYVPLEIADGEALVALVRGLRGGTSVRGLNVTAPFKEQALAAADQADGVAEAAGAANLLLFEAEGSVSARNTDGLGLLYALGAQAGMDVRGARAVVLGAGGAARGAVSTLLAAGAAEVRIVNRTRERADVLARSLGRGCSAWAWSDQAEAVENADLLINATTLGREGGEPLEVSLDGLARCATVMDMGYRPLRSALLGEAELRGLRVADGLAMLIGQAIPTFEAVFGRPPPGDLDIRAVALEAMG